jgi:hypothetical protein
VTRDLLLARGLNTCKAGTGGEPPPIAAANVPYPPAIRTGRRRRGVPRLGLGLELWMYGNCSIVATCSRAKLSFGLDARRPSAGEFKEGFKFLALTSRRLPAPCPSRPGSPTVTPTVVRGNLKGNSGQWPIGTRWLDSEGPGSHAGADNASTCISECSQLVTAEGHGQSPGVTTAGTSSAQRPSPSPPTRSDPAPHRARRILLHNSIRAMPAVHY